MERLTVYTPNGYESINPVDLCLDECSDINFERILDKLGAYEDFEEIFREKMTNVACDFLSDKEEFGKWLDRNKWIAKKCDEWARAEEQGRLVKMPCKVGDTVYAIIFDYEKEQYAIKESEIIEVKKNINGVFFVSLISKPAFRFNDFGKTVFLTKSEAEAKLAELRGTKNNEN